MVSQNNDWQKENFVRCLPHVINLIVKVGLDKLGIALKTPKLDLPEIIVTEPEGETELAAATAENEKEISSIEVADPAGDDGVEPEEESEEEGDDSNQHANQTGGSTAAKQLSALEKINAISKKIRSSAQRMEMFTAIRAVTDKDCLQTPVLAIAVRWNSWHKQAKVALELRKVHITLPPIR